MSGFYVSPGLTAASPEDAESTAYDLFVSNGFDLSGQRLIRLDPDTLADDPNGVAIALGTLPAVTTVGPDRALADWTASPDGSTLVGLEYPYGYDWVDPPSESVTLVVRDGRTGEERGRYPVHEPIAYPGIPSMSADGSTVVFEADRAVLVKERLNRVNNWYWRVRRAEHVAEAVDPYGGNPPPMLRWYVYDAASGALRATVDATGPEAFGWWIDPHGTRLYYMAVPSWPPDSGETSTTRIVAHDLATGDEVGRVKLPGVASGVGQEEGYVSEMLIPGAALSPDGATLAVVSTDLSQVTLIDTHRMVVERKIVVRNVPGRLERLGRWLGLLPSEAAAKGTAGTWVSTVFASDGRHLYVYGDTTTMSETEPFERRGLGLQVIDLTNGEVVARAFPDVWFTDVMPAPDGQTLFAVQSTSDTLLQRIDAKTLELEANRIFTGYRWFVIRSGSIGP